MKTQVSEFFSNLEKHQKQIIKTLTCVETYKAAKIEYLWSERAWKKIQNDSLIRNSSKHKKSNIYVSLPSNLPLYSFILYALYPALMGNNVVVRPSSYNRESLYKILDITLSMGICKMKFIDDDFNTFLKRVHSEADTFIYTGSWNRAKELEMKLPLEIKYIYNGSGVCPFVVTESANLIKAADKIISTRFFNSGQDCLSTERVYIHENCFDELVDILTERFQSVVIGENVSPYTDIGPLSQKTIENVIRLLKGSGIIRIIYSRGDMDNIDFPILLECESDAAIVLNEKFAPVLPLVKYSSDSKLLNMLHMADFALGITIYGKSKIIPQLEFGHIALDRTLYDFEESGNAFGGFKKSGLIREGKEGMKKRSGPTFLSIETSLPIGW
jgi:acyl-CoA reductase-like NAD-dependent aldehyde dehydrogenase